MNSHTQVLEVWGDFACYSRPELKVERFSYPLPPPSAVRGVFEAIYAKPEEFRWQVERVEVLATPSYIALRRNEVKEKASVAAVEQWAKGQKAPEPIWADGEGDEKGRTQRQTMALRRRPLSSLCHYPAMAGLREAACRFRGPVPATGGGREVLLPTVSRLPRVRGVFRTAGSFRRRPRARAVERGCGANAIRRVRPFTAGQERRCARDQSFPREGEGRRDARTSL